MMVGNDVGVGFGAVVLVVGPLIMVLMVVSPWAVLELMMVVVVVMMLLLY